MKKEFAGLSLLQEGSGSGSHLRTLPVEKKRNKSLVSCGHQYRNLFIWLHRIALPLSR
eukprot:m.18343 g.18343  ORF g.18343 m.18343 type:complete len:58 (-) comp4950_c0_seq1:513-686(-)